MEYLWLIVAILATKSAISRCKLSKYYKYKLNSNSDYVIFSFFLPGNTHSICKKGSFLTASHCRCRGVGQGMKQTYLHLWYSLFQVQWDKFVFHRFKSRFWINIGTCFWWSFLVITHKLVAQILSSNYLVHFPQLYVTLANFGYSV